MESLKALLLTMKMYFILCILLFSGVAQSAIPDTALQRSNGLLRFLVQQEGARDFALQSVIGKRCTRYLPSNEARNCQKSVSSMIKSLDYDIIIPKGEERESGGSWNPRSFVFVAFKTHLIRLLENEKTHRYLLDLNEKLYEYLVGEKEKINIWNVTLSHYRTPYLSTLAIAALFQDTSLMKLHLAYLEEAKIQGGEQFTSNKELLSRVIDTINLILDSSEDHYRKLFYPEEIQKDLNRNIYHFYVPMFLSMSLKRKGLSAAEAFIGPLMLNLSYEFVTTSSDYRFIYRDPKNIESLHKIKDIFGGYCGALSGIGVKRCRKSFLSIRENFVKSTAEGVKYLISPVKRNTGESFSLHE